MKTYDPTDPGDLRGPMPRRLTLVPPVDMHDEAQASADLAMLFQRAADLARRESQRPLTRSNLALTHAADAVMLEALANECHATAQRIAAIERANGRPLQLLIGGMTEEEELDNLPY